MLHEIKSEMRGNALVVTFSRPEHGNAMTIDMANQLYQVLKPATTDPAIRAVMLYGEGGHFMTGIDINIYSKSIDAGVDIKNEILRPYHSAIREIQVMDKPVLAVVAGTVAKAGFGVMLACDLVLAGRSTRFRAGYATLAMTPDGGSSFFLTRKVGMAKATEILMLNEEFDAVEAERLHLVNNIVDDAQLMDHAYEWIDRLAEGPTKALGGMKRLVAKAYEQNLGDHIALEHTYWNVCSRTFDFRNAVKARLAGVKAKFTGA